MSTNDYLLSKISVTSMVFSAFLASGTTVVDYDPDTTEKIKNIGEISPSQGGSSSSGSSEGAEDNDGAQGQDTETSSDGTEEKGNIDFSVPDDAIFVEDRSIGSSHTASVYHSEEDFPERIVEDSQLPEGVQIVVQEGSKGKIEYVDVKDSQAGYSKRLISPVEQVVRLGTKDHEVSPFIEPSLATQWAADEQRQRDEEQRQRNAEAQRVAEQELSEDNDNTASENNGSSSGGDETSNSTNRPQNSSGYRLQPQQGVECGGWGDLIRQSFGDSQYDKACSVMMCESRGDPKAQNPVSTASGLYQFLDTTWHSARQAIPGGSDYPRAKDAPGELQIQAAAQWQRDTAWSQWVCQ